MNSAERSCSLCRQSKSHGFFAFLVHEPRGDYNIYHFCFLTVLKLFLNLALLILLCSMVLCAKAVLCMEPIPDLHLPGASNTRLPVMEPNSGETIPHAPWGQYCPWLRTTVLKCLYFFPDILAFFSFPLNPLELVAISHPVSVLRYECELLCIRRGFWPQLSGQPFVPGPGPTRASPTLLPDNHAVALGSPPAQNA